VDSLFAVVGDSLMIICARAAGAIREANRV
jgi:hypothetical protein